VASSVRRPARDRRAAVHAAAALRVELPCGLATLGHFADLEAPSALDVIGGAIQVPGGPGLGL
jgi:hypothetical protein